MSNSAGPNETKGIQEFVPKCFFSFVLPTAADGNWSEDF